MVLIKSKMSSSNDMGLDDIKAVDEVLMTVQGTDSNKAVDSLQKTPSPSRRKRFASLALNAAASKSNINGGGSSGKNGKKPQRQYSSVFPCPILQSLDLESPPHGSYNNLGLVNRHLIQLKLFKRETQDFKPH